MIKLRRYSYRTGALLLAFISGCDQLAAGVPPTQDPKTVSPKPAPSIDAVTIVLTAPVASVGERIATSTIALWEESQSPASASVP